MNMTNRVKTKVDSNLDQCVSVIDKSSLIFIPQIDLNPKVREGWLQLARDAQINPKLMRSYTKWSHMCYMYIVRKRSKWSVALFPFLLFFCSSLGGVKLHLLKRKRAELLQNREHWWCMAWEWSALVFWHYHLIHKVYIHHTLHRILRRD